MRISFSSICLLLVIFVSSLAALGQGQKATSPPEHKPIDWFYQDANYHSKTLLFKVLQFTAPYPRYYQELSLDSNGHAFTGRIVPNWAIQASETAKLEDTLLNQIRQMLSQLTLPPSSTVSEPQSGQLHTALVFYDGNAYSRYDYNGPLPSQVQAIVDILQKELVSAAAVKAEQFLVHHKLMEETYGDWQNTSGVGILTGSRMHILKGMHGLLLTLTGQHNTIPASPRTPVSIYHALVFYPGGGVTGSGSGGSWSDDPVSTEVVVWSLPKGAGPDSEKTSERKLEVKYHAIDGTISVGGNTYQLVHGNMFVIRMSENWTPIVVRLDAKLDEQTTEQRVLERFKSTMRNDASFQLLELN